MELVVADSPEEQRQRRGVVRRRPITIDLTRNEEEEEEVQVVEQPSRRRRAVIDLTLDNEDELQLLPPPANAPPRVNVPVPVPLPPHRRVPDPAPRAQQFLARAQLEHTIAVTQQQIRDLQHLRRTVAMPHRPDPPKPKGKPVKLKRVPRKPFDGCSCPICFEEFSSSRLKSVFCRFGCGGNVHASCMDKWRLDRLKNPPPHGPLLCVLCRAPWNGKTTE